MLTNIVVFILIIIGLILGIAPHNKLCAIPTMIGVNSAFPTGRLSTSCHRPSYFGHT